MKQNETNLMPKNAEIFYCEKCDFKCSKKSNFNKHLTTAKHKMKQNETKKMPKNADSLHNFICEFCCDVFQSRTTLWRHKKNCKSNIKKSATLDKKSATLDKKSATFCKKSATSEKTHTINDANMDKNDNESMYVGVINKLMTDNNDLRQFIMEQSKELQNQNIEHKRETNEILNKVMTMNKTQINNTINGNINNNKFNIQLFLHDKCQDAINFSDFIEKIEVTPQDLENNAQLGFVEGISKILVDNLKQMSIYERPIHCTDVKRETMYIKNDNNWNKEENGEKLRGAIQEVSRKSNVSLLDWKDKNPEHNDINSEFSERCIVIQQQCNAGVNRDNYYPKVIKSIVKETAIDKNIDESNLID